MDTLCKIFKRNREIKVQLFFFHVWHLTAVGVDWLTVTSGFSCSLASLHAGFLTYCFCQQNHFTSAYNFIYISPNPRSNKGHSSRQLQGHVLERDLALYVFVRTGVCCEYPKKSQHMHTVEMYTNVERG